MRGWKRGRVAEAEQEKKRSAGGIVRTLEFSLCGPPDWLEPMVAMGACDEGGNGGGQRHGPTHWKLGFLCYVLSIADGELSTIPRKGKEGGNVEGSK